MWMWRRACAYLATTGVRPRVSGTRTGSKALVQRNAIAKEDPPLVTALAIQDRSSGLASALRSFSAQRIAP